MSLNIFKYKSEERTIKKTVILLEHEEQAVRELRRGSKDDLRAEGQDGEGVRGQGTEVDFTPFEKSAIACGVGRMAVAGRAIGNPRWTGEDDEMVKNLRRLFA